MNAWWIFIFLHLLCVKHITGTPSPSSHSNHIQPHEVSITISIPPIQQTNIDRMSTCARHISPGNNERPRVTQPLSGRARHWTHIFFTPMHVPFPQNYPLISASMVLSVIQKVCTPHCHPQSSPNIIFHFLLPISSLKSPCHQRV